VIRAHGFEDRLVGIAQKRSGFGILTSARQGFAEAARKDRVLNFFPATIAIEIAPAPLINLFPGVRLCFIPLVGFGELLFPLWLVTRSWQIQILKHDPRRSTSGKP
jgi:hypothetical protein